MVVRSAKECLIMSEIYNSEHTDNGVQYLFFTHIQQIELMCANSDILLMDVTYSVKSLHNPFL